MGGDVGVWVGKQTGSSQGIVSHQGLLLEQLLLPTEAWEGQRRLTDISLAITAQSNVSSGGKLSLYANNFFRLHSNNASRILYIIPPQDFVVCLSTFPRVLWKSHLHNKHGLDSFPYSFWSVPSTPKTINNTKPYTVSFQSLFSFSFFSKKKVPEGASHINNPNHRNMFSLQGILSSLNA